ncbi:hypothetical protein EDD17DRAFT_1505856 [Pisolithus thermaeus]|nr:hypothetical protein EV401DRAFT_2198123 [Pisolithus croceorrhizus]KAI6165386.1 hypothetical protein EDD17DRAFT_1505856 [Pisolithus thermaeus]
MLWNSDPSSVRREVKILEEATALGQETLALFQQGHHHCSMFLQSCRRPPEKEDVRGYGCDTRFGGVNRAASRSFGFTFPWTSCKYGELGMVGDSKEAITIGREALELCTPGHPGRCESLHNLACSLRKRYDKLWVVDDLEEAIALGRTALELCPLGHPDRGICLQNLACDLKKRPMQKTATGDLEESIELLRLALEPRPAGHPDRSSSIYELALSDDLEEAILCGRVALELCPSGHPDHGVVLYNLACDFWRKLQFLHQATSVDQFQKQAVVADLDNAICLATYALEFRLPAEDDSVAHGSGGWPRRQIQMNPSCVGERARFQAQHAIIDLKKAITFYRHVLQLCPGGHPNRASSLHDLAHGLADRFREQPSAINLDEAIALQQEALQILGRRDAGYDVSRRSLAACVQMKIRTQVVMMSSDVSCVTHFDVEQVIRDVAFETFKTMPTRLLHTHDSGILYDRDAQVSHFFSRRYRRLVAQWKTCGRGEPSLRDIEGQKKFEARIRF